jgi:ribose transport system ATP-binding protein
MKVLSGAHAPDSGSMTLEGTEFSPLGPQAARDAGVAMIYQELNLAADLSVEDNVMLGQEQHRFGVVRRSEQRRRVRQALETLGHPELHPAAIVSSLSVGAQQLVEIARALVFNARVVVFDEPTSSLPRADVDRLFDVIRGLRQAGLAIIYISHFLEEIREIADAYTVLRDGETVGRGLLGDVRDEEIISLIVGRSVNDQFPRVPHQIGDVVVEIAGLSGQSLPEDLCLDLHQGEILGIAGLVGAGRTEFLRCLFGLDEVRQGNIRIAGNVTPQTPRDRIRAGCGFLSEDRKSEGLAQDLSVNDNMTLSCLHPYSIGTLLNLSKRRQNVRQWISTLSIKTTGPEQQIQNLSGGNQQKVALARVLHQQADILLLDEPTRGIDIGTKSEIYRLMGELAASGKSIVFVSSYLPELLAVCDRVGVMARGRLREVRAAEDWTEESAMAYAVASDN